MNYTLASESGHLENGETRQAYRNSKVFENSASQTIVQTFKQMPLTPKHRPEAGSEVVADFAATDHGFAVGVQQGNVRDAEGRAGGHGRFPRKYLRRRLEILRGRGVEEDAATPASTLRTVASWWVEVRTDGGFEAVLKPKCMTPRRMAQTA